MRPRRERLGWQPRAHGGLGLNLSDSPNSPCETRKPCLRARKIGAPTGAPFGKRSPEWLARAIAIASGTDRRAPERSSCASPETTQGQQFSRLSRARAARTEKVLTAAIPEAYFHSVSPRAANDLVMAMAMGGTWIPKSWVCRLCEEIDGEVKTFLDRQIECDRPYLWIDVTYVKAQEDGRIVSAAAVGAVGVKQRQAARLEHRDGPRQSILRHGISLSHDI